MAQSQTINISTQTILKVLIVSVLMLFLWTVRDVLVIVFVALVLAAAIDPSITKMEHHRIPRGVGISLIYIVIVALIAVLVVSFVPLVTDQLDQFTKAFPELYSKGVSTLQNAQGVANVSGLEKALGSINSTLSQLTKGFFSGVVSFFGGVISIIGVLVLTFYLTMEEQGMKRIAVDLAPAKYRPYLTRLFNRIENRLGQWLRGQLILGLTIAILVYIGLLVLNVKYALVLALFSGLTELVPIVGAYIGAIPAVIVAFSISPLAAVWTIVMFIIVQQLEHHLIVPRVMSKTTGLNPIIVIVAVLVGAKIAGILGVLLAVPTTIIITTFIEDFLEEKKIEDTRLEPVEEI